MKFIKISGLSTEDSAYSTYSSWHLKPTFEELVGLEPNKQLYLAIIDQRECTVHSKYMSSYQLQIFYFGLLSVKYKQSSDASLWGMRFYDDNTYNIDYNYHNDRFFVTYQMPASFADVYIDSDNTTFEGEVSDFIAETEPYVIAMISEMYKG